jgi:hypothetical protein
LELDAIEQCFPPGLKSIYAHIEKLSAHFCYRLVRDGCLDACVPEAFYLRQFVLDILREEGYAADNCPQDDSTRKQLRFSN